MTTWNFPDTETETLRSCLEYFDLPSTDRMAIKDLSTHPITWGSVVPRLVGCTGNRSTSIILELTTYLLKTLLRSLELRDKCLILKMKERPT